MYRFDAIVREMAKTIDRVKGNRLVKHGATIIDIQSERICTVKDNLEGMVNPP
jgi:hypothetical protein